MFLMYSSSIGFPVQTKWIIFGKLYDPSEFDLFANKKSLFELKCVKGLDCIKFTNNKLTLPFHHVFPQHCNVRK